MRWSDLPFVAFDTETTGLSPYTGDRVIEVGLVTFRLAPDGTVVHTEAFGELINPEMPIPRAATEVSTIRDADVVGKPVFSDLAEQIAARFEGAIAVAHNYPFDHAFLTQELGRVGVPWIEPLAAIDTVDLSHRRFPGASSHKLEALAKRAGVALVDAHRAVNDARACGEALAALLRKAAVPDDLDALLDWAGGLGAPPEEATPWFGLDPTGRPVFTSGPHAGDPVERHPQHLAWMTMARAHVDGMWRWRFPDRTRAWARRWLDVRGTQRFRANPKSVRAQDWGLDPCLVEPPVVSTAALDTPEAHRPADDGLVGLLP